MADKNLLLYKHLQAHFIPLGSNDDQKMDDCLLEFLLSHVKNDHRDIVDKKELSKKVHIFNNQLTTQWKKSDCTPERFQMENKTWLNSLFTIPYLGHESDPITSVNESTLLSDEGYQSSHPSSSINENEEQTSDANYSRQSSDELLRAAYQSLVNEGKDKLANLILQVSTTKGVSEILALMKKAKEMPEVQEYSVDAAAVVLMQEGMSRKLYQFLRMDSKANCGIFIYPPFYKAAEAKKKYLMSKLEEQHASEDEQQHLPRLEEPYSSVSVPEKQCSPKFEEQCSLENLLQILNE